MVLYFLRVREYIGSFYKQLSVKNCPSLVEFENLLEHIDLLVCRTSYIMYHITTYMFKKNVNGFLENEEMNKWNKNLKPSSNLLWFYILWKQLFHHLNQAFEWV